MFKRRRCRFNVGSPLDADGASEPAEHRVGTVAD
jgi:hypothetical protein